MKRVPFPIGLLRGDTVAASRALLGAVLWHKTAEGITAGRIVETEAYLRDDPACHASRGLTPRNAVMFGRAGLAYVYRIYGMYDCFNVVTAAKGVGEAVLIRALEPLEGLELMAHRRGREKVRDLCSGPGKLMLAMGLGAADNHADLSRGDLRLFAAESYPDSGLSRKIAVGPRIGITKAADWPLRFWFEGNPFVSRK